MLPFLPYVQTHCLTGTDDVEALEPLRQRYSAQHYALRKFYYECSNLKYLTGLINVPKLGQVCYVVIYPLKGNISQNLRNLPISLTVVQRLTFLLVPLLLLRQRLRQQLLSLMPRLSMSKHVF